MLIAANIGCESKQAIFYLIKLCRSDVACTVTIVTTVTMTPEPSRHLAPVPHLAHGVDLSVKGREEEDETPLSEEDSCHGVITVN